MRDFPQQASAPPRHADTSLDEVIANLSAHPAVDAVLTMGSTATGALHAASDYDLLVVLSEMPVLTFLAMTTIDGRMAELYFTTAQTVDTLIALDAPIPADKFEANILTWLQSGRIVFDRSVRLTRLRDKVAAGRWVAPPAQLDVYNTWFHINYNIRHARRIVASDDPAYLKGLDFRLLYSVVDLWLAYFKVRSLLWQGEKACAAHFAEHDPAYLDLFNRYLTEPDRARKLDLYEQMAQITLEPVGGLMPLDASAVQLDSDAEWQANLPAQALNFVNHLIS